MVLRFLIRFLANNERIVQKLSESYPMRRSAQLLVALFLRSKKAIQDTGINETRIKSFAQRLKENFKEEIENAKKDLEKQRRK